MDMQSFNDQRTNFFEGNVVNYSKGSIDFDDFLGLIMGSKNDIELEFYQIF